MYCWPCSAWWPRMRNNQAGALAYLQPREFNQALTRKGTADQPGQAHLAWAFFLLVHRGQSRQHTATAPPRPQICPTAHAKGIGDSFLPPSARNAMYAPAMPIQPRRHRTNPIRSAPLPPTARAQTSLAGTLQVLLSAPAMVAPPFGFPMKRVVFEKRALAPALQVQRTARSVERFASESFDATATAQRAECLLRSTRPRPARS